jgi:hypothetical protein
MRCPLYLSAHKARDQSQVYVAKSGAAVIPDRLRSGRAAEEERVLMGRPSKLCDVRSATHNIHDTARVPLPGR